MPSTIPHAQQRQLVKKAAAQNRLQYYGADMVNPDEFAELAGYGANFVFVALGASRNTWSSYLAAAEASGIKLFIWPLGGCQASTPWCAAGESWNLSAGEDALRYAQEYISGGGEALLGVLSTHEPFWTEGLSVSQVRNLYSAMKTVAPDVPIFAHLGSMNYWETHGYPITNGLWDWASIWLHCFNGEGSCEAAKQVAVADRALVENKGLNMKLLFSVQTFAMGGYRMPSYSELYDFTCDLITQNTLDAIMYYSWHNPAGYSDILYNHYHPPGGLNGIIEDVYNDCVQGLPPVTPIPKPTPTPSDCPNFDKGDANCDNKVDELDYVVWWQNYGTGVGADFNGDGVTDELDYVIWWRYYGSSL